MLNSIQTQKSCLATSNVFFDKINFDHNRKNIIYMLDFSG